MRYDLAIAAILSVATFAHAGELLQIQPVGVALRGQDYRFVQANDKGGIAGSTRVVGDWETFSLDDYGNSMVSFRAHNGRLWYFQDGRGEPKATGEKPGPWEKMQLGYENDGGTPRFITLRADEGRGLFVAMIPSESYKIRTYADKVGAWERFDMYNVFQAPETGKAVLVAALEPEMRRVAGGLRKEFRDSESHEIKLGGKVKVGEWSKEWSGHVEIDDRKDLGFGDVRLLLHARKLEGYISVRDATLDFDYKGKVRFEIPGNAQAERVLGIRTGIAHTENFRGAAFVRVSCIVRVEATREGVFLREPHAQDFQVEVRNIRFAGAIPNGIELNTDYVKRRVNEKLREEEGKFIQVVNAALDKELKDKRVADFGTLMVQLQKLFAK